jgi:hypothetical protein
MHHDGRLLVPVSDLSRPQQPVAGFSRELESARRLPHATGAQQQLEIYERTFSRRAVVEEMLSRHEWQPG